MVANIFCQTITEFYSIENKYNYTKLKNLISPVISYVERNLNEVSYKKYGISQDFKEKFSYIATNLDNDSLDKFIKTYKRIRAINVHARTFYSNKSLKKLFTYDLSNLTNDFAFLELDAPYNNHLGEITVYGMLFILGILLSDEQYWSFINLLANEKRFSLTEYLTYEMKKELKEKHIGINNIRKTEKDIPIVYCAEQFVVPIISETYLILEEEILKKHKIKPKNPLYLSFPETVNALNIDDNLKRELIFLRNMWAHGNSFYYTSAQNNTIIKFIDVMQLLSNTEYEPIAHNALKKLKITLLQLKYKRPVEMVIKFQQERLNKISLLHRLEKMTSFNDKDDLIPIFMEKRLEPIDHCQVVFKYNNKEEKLGCYYFEHITIIEHNSLDRIPFVIDGEQTDITSFKEFVLPEYKSLEVSTNPVVTIHKSMIAETKFVTKISICYEE